MSKGGAKIKMESKMSIRDRLKNAWNVFRENDELGNRHFDRYNSYSHNSYGSRPDRYRLSSSNERTIVNAIYNRIGIDVAAIDVRHVVLDEKQRFSKYTYSSLDDCLSWSANIDQTGRALIQDVAMTLLNDGCAAVVPVDTDEELDEESGVTSKKILSLRVGQILEWYPEHVKVHLYNEKKGEREEVMVSKYTTAIIENPLYSVMNEPNGVVKRLIEKMNMLDNIDNQTASGKFNMFVKLPYAV